jgi:predicted O-methyltransferase YrrM
VNSEAFRRLQEEYEALQRLPGFMDLEMMMLFEHLAEVMPSEDPVLEIGVYCGRSLGGLACSFPQSRIVGVDPFYENYAESPAFEDEAAFLSRTSNQLSAEARKRRFWDVVRFLDREFSLNTEARVELREITQEAFLEQHNESEQFQLVHIDGEHTFSAVSECLDALQSLLRPNAWVVVDDLLNPGFPDISDAVHSHAAYRKQLHPVFYGFNKAVYLFSPSSLGLVDAAVTELKRLYEVPGYTTRTMHDG